MENTYIDIIDLVQQYTYLSILLDEHLKFDLCDDLFTKSGREFYYLLYQSVMLIKNSVMICSHLYSYMLMKLVAFTNLRNVIFFYLGIHKYAPIPGF